MHEKGKIVASAALTLLLFAAAANITTAEQTQPQTTPILYVSPSTYTAKKVGEVFQIQVKVQQAFSLFRYDFKLGFNATLLSCVSALQGDFFPAAKSSSIITVKTDYVSVNCTLNPGENPISGSGILAFIDFNATFGVPYPTTRKSCPLDVYDSHLYNGENPPSPILHGSQDGVYYTPWIAPDLQLSLQTSKTTYYLDESILVSGGLTGNEYPVTDAYVAVEVYNPKQTDQPMVTRTIPTGAIPPAGPVEITSAITCDSATGLPKTVFRRGQYLAVKVSVKNNSNKQQTVLILVNVYDSRNAAQGLQYSAKTIEPGQTLDTIKTFYIENVFALGNGKAYASVLSGWAKNGGVALCNEKAAEFTVSTVTLSGDKTVAAPTGVGVLVAGNYEVSFRIPYTGKESTGGNPIGTYTIYACSTFMEKTASNSRTIQVKLAGDINNDRKTNLSDLVILAKAYGTRPGDANWNPAADLNKDNVISLSDLVLLALNYGREI